MSKESRNNDVLVGLLVVAGFSLLVVMTFLIHGNLAGNNVTISATFNNVAGLETGSPVLVRGVRKGRVTDIVPHMTPEGEKVRVEMLVNRSIEIYSNAEIALVQQGFIGDKRVEINPGTAEEGATPIAGDTIIAGTESQDLSAVIARAEGIAADVQATVASLRELLSSEENVAAINAAIRDTATAIENLNQYLNENRENVARITDNVAVLSADMKVITQGIRTDLEEGGRLDVLVEDAAATVATVREQTEALTARVDKTLATVDGIAADVQGAVSELREEGTATVQSARALIDRTGTDVEETLANLNAISDDLAVVAERVRSGEGTLGKLINDPRPFEDLRSSIQALRNVLLRRQEGIYDTSIQYDRPTGADEGQRR